MSARQIIVGIDGSEAADNALQWAAAEAARRSLDLLIVHATDVVEADALSTATSGPVLRERAEYGRQLLVRAEREVGEQYPQVAVKTLLRTEEAADLLIEAGESAEMVVVGTEGNNRLVDLLFGSISRQVAGHAKCPVVTIGKQAMQTSGERRVVVGVSGSPAGLEALRFAFREAADRDATLVAVRAYGVFGRSAHAEIFAPLPGLRHTEADVLHDAVERIRVEFPEVPVRTELIDTPAEQTLPRVAEGADLLVLGCHYRDGHWPSRLGPIAAALLHRSPCPLAVIDSPQPAAAV